MLFRSRRRRRRRPPRRPRGGRGRGGPHGWRRLGPSSRRARAAAAHEDLPGLALLAASWGGATASSSSAGRWTVPPRPVRLVPVLRHDIMWRICVTRSLRLTELYYMCVYMHRVSVKQTNYSNCKAQNQAGGSANGGSQLVLEVLEKSGPTLAAQIDRLPTPTLWGMEPRVDRPPLGRWGGGCVVSFAAVIAYRAVSLGSCLAWTSAVLAGVHCALCRWF